MKITGTIAQNQANLLVLVFTVVFGMLQHQRLNFTFKDNLAINSALKTLLKMQTQSDISIDHLLSISSVLAAKTANDVQVQTRNVIMGNLYWKIGEKKQAKKYWVEADIEPEFFVKKIRTIEMPSGLDYLNRAILLAPNHSELLYYKGLHFEKNGDTFTAKQWYDMAEEYGNWVNLAFAFTVFYERGQLLYKNQQLAEAGNAFDMAVKFAKETTVDDVGKVANAHRKLGIIAQQNGRIADAKTHFLKAAELYPEDFWNYLSLALIAETEKETEEKVFEYFDYAHTIAPQELQAYIYPASHYLGRNQLDKWRYFCTETPGYLQHQQQWIDVCQTANGLE